VGGGVPRLRRAERHQVRWRPFSLDELLEADHRARLVWQFVRKRGRGNTLESRAA